MDQLDLIHGLKGMLISLIGLVGANVLSRIVQGIWAFARRNMGPTREQFNSLTEALNKNNVALDGQKLTVAKMASDLRRIYIFLKVIAGDRWPDIRRKVEEIEKEQNLN